MSITAFLVTAFIEAMSPGPRMLACTFPAPSPDERPISLAVEARPSLMDRVDQFRVSVHLADEGEFGGLAQPIDRTDARDVLIRARASDETFYTIGLRDDGLAALNLLKVRTEAEQSRMVETRKGACRDFKRVLDTWLSS
jgi:hypothetical protein